MKQSKPPETPTPADPPPTRRYAITEAQLKKIEGLVHSLDEDIFWDCPISGAEYERLQQAGNEAELEKATDHGPVAGYHKAMSWVEQVQAITADLRMPHLGGRHTEQNEDPVRVFVPVTPEFRAPTVIIQLMREGEQTGYAQNPPYKLSLLLHVAQEIVKEGEPTEHEKIVPRAAERAVSWLEAAIELYGPDAMPDWA